jgi:uncharacterized protein YbjT (DUF2867 family)
MKVLVTGGTGVVGESAVRTLHDRGHHVRVLTRHADREKKWWPDGVEGWQGDIGDEKSIRGAAAGCEAVLHIAGIAEEHPPETTFQSVNIDGTRYVVLEAERAGVRKLVYVSSLGADRGQSEYHKSKYVAEDVVQLFGGDWVVVRPGAVYGPGDEHLSVLLRMVRSLPVIPTIGDGDQKFQPIWHEDVAEALALTVERVELCKRILEIAGPELTSQNDLVQRLRALTGRSAVQAPVPELLTSWGLKALDAIGVDVPFTEQQLAMLTEGNYIQAGGVNALTEVLGISPTPLGEGLARLCKEQPEQHPSDGVGALMKKRYWTDIRGSQYDADSLFAHLREHLSELMPSVVKVFAEGQPRRRIEEGDTLTLEIPVRGHIQVRAVEVSGRRITLLTVAGHPIAGAVRFFVAPQRGAIRFEVQVFDRAASLIDQVMLRTIGAYMQRGTWIGLVENVATAAGGTSTDVQSTEEELNDDDLRVVDEWAKALSAQLSRKTTSSGRD